MTKNDIGIEIAKKTGVEQVVAKQIVQATLDSIVEVLATEGRLELRDFGVFDVRVKKARTARNPRTGVEVMVPERRAVHFKPGKIMAARVGNGVKPVEVSTTAVASSENP